MEYAAGYLVYQRDGTLMAQPFDETRGRLTNDAVPVLEDVQTNAGNGRGAFPVSKTGTLVYRTGGPTEGTTILTWYDEAGMVV